MRLLVSASIVLALVFMVPRSASAELIHYYRFDSDASDSVGTAHGNLLGGASVTNGYLSLDGIDDYVQFSEKLVPTSGNYSVALFARQMAPKGEFVEFISQGFSTGPGFYLGLDPSGNIRASDSWLPNTSVLWPGNNEFHHLALTVDSFSNQSRLYVNGNLAATLSSAIVTTTFGDNTRLGRQFDPFGEFFAGDLDEVRIYNRTLSSSEVFSLATVPEPGSLALILGGLPFLHWRIRRRRCQG